MSASGSSRDRILARVRAAAGLREPVLLPDVLDGPVMPAQVVGDDEAIERFARQFSAAGGETVIHADLEAAVAWARQWYADFPTAAVSAWVPQALRPRAPAASPDVADLAVSVAVAAAADTGTLLLDSREGRRLQLLAPVHLVWVSRSTVSAALGDALRAVRDVHGAAVGLHSGPSKSADIGGVLVRGVHGPGRVVAAIVDDESVARPAVPSAG